MTATSLPTAIVDFAQLNSIARLLRQAGAKFSTSLSGQGAILKFQKLPERARVLLKPCDENSSQPLVKASYPAPETSQAIGYATPKANATTASMVDLPHPLTLPNALTVGAEMASLETLGKLSKTRLKSLAKQFEIPGRTKLDQQGLARALAGRVLISEL